MPLDGVTVVARRSSAAGLSRRAGCDDLVGLAGLAWRYPPSPPGGPGSGEVSEPGWVPADFDVVPGHSLYPPKTRIAIVYGNFSPHLRTTRDR